MRFIFLAVVLAMIGWLGYSALKSPAPQNGASRPHMQSDPVFDAAMNIRAAIKADSFASADSELEQMFSQSNEKDWSDYPFAGVMMLAVPGSDPGFGPHLDGWVQAFPKSGMAYLTRAKYAIDRGWFIRGRNAKDKTPRPEDIKYFTALQQQAYRDIVQYIGIRDDNPYAYGLLIGVAASVGGNALQNQVFSRAISRFPAHPEYYEARLQQLEPAWGGTIRQMLDFVSASTANVGDKSLFRYLWIELYDDVADSAGQVCRGGGGERNPACEAAFPPSMSGGDPESRLKDAFGLYNVNAYWFDERFLKKPHPPQVVALAARTLPADDYALNYVLGDANNPLLTEGSDGEEGAVSDKSDRAAYRKAYDYYRISFEGAQKFPFPDTREKNLRLADIANELAVVSVKLGDNKAALQYSDYAIGLYDKRFEYHHTRCIINFNQKKYAAAADDCGTAIDLNDTSAVSRYTRAQAYLKLGNFAGATPDFKTLIDQGDNYKTEFVLMGLIESYANLGQFQDELNLFGQHPEMFAMQNKKASAKNYAYRCSAYQKLGQYQKALEDCNQSLDLEYVTAVSARKQQLMKQLKMSH